MTFDLDDGIDIHELHDAVTREEEDPQDGQEPAPLWMWLISALTVAFSFYYLGSFSSGFQVDKMELDPQVETQSTQPSGRPTYEDRDPLELGKERFTRCASCHQANGQGVSGRYPPLAGSEWVTSDPEIVVRILLNGLSGPVKVRGNKYLGAMPKWSAWTDAEIAAVLTYVRSSFGNRASAISFDDVGKIRKKSKNRTTPWTSTELKALAPIGGTKK